MARKRKGEMHEQMRFEREQESRKVQEEFPEVAHIRISLTFEDNDNQGRHPGPQELNYGPNNRAFFELKCPSYVCVMGGFNFRSTVGEAISARRDVTEGTEKCTGWQDREGIHKHGCDLEALFEIHIEYKGAA